MLGTKVHRDLDAAEERLRISWRRRGMSVDRAAVVARRNVAAVEQMNRMGDAAMRASDVLGRVKLVHRRRIFELACATCSRSRKVAPEGWPEAFAGVGLRYIGEGVDRASVLVALEACWDVLPHTLPDVGFDAVLGFVKEAEGQPRMNTDEHGSGVEPDARGIKVVPNCEC